MEANRSETEHFFDTSPQQALKKATINLDSLYHFLNPCSFNFSIAKGTLLSPSSYTVLSCLDGGSFGKVFKATNGLTSETVAIKILKSGQDPEKEIAALKALNKLDSQSSYFVKLLDVFYWNDRTCLVFEHLSKTLFQVLEENSSLSLPHIKAFAWQIFTSLSVMQFIGITHCDLKLENIMLVSAHKAGIKICLLYTSPSPRDS